jgi:metallophosphoesterase (TIGR00282 family)
VTGGQRDLAGRWTSRGGRCYARFVRILYIGEIVGSAGVFCVKSQLASLRRELSVDFVIACGDGATGGFGIGKNHAVYLHKLGVDVLTSGECIYYKKDMVPHLPRASYILRAANYPYGNPGRGWTLAEAAGQKIAVLNLLGQSGFHRVHLANPFHLATDLVARIAQETRLIVVDFHAATTAEKYTMFYHLEGQVSAVLGSHTKVLTADGRVLPGGTAVIAGTGRTGSRDSVGGLEPEIEIRKFTTQIHELSKVSWRGLELQGVLVDVGADGKATGIQIVRQACEGAQPPGEQEEPRE